MSRRGSLRRGRGDRENPLLLPPVDDLTVIRALELDRPMTDEEYAKAREKWQGRLAMLSRDAKFQRTGVVAAFEGNDAAGEGVRVAARHAGARRSPLRRRPHRRAHGGGARRAMPSPALLAAHPEFDRFAALRPLVEYGRVLVERVEGFCNEVWTGVRAYGEINDFERELVEHSLVVLEVLARHRQADAARALPRAREDGVQALQDPGRRLAQHLEVGRLRSRGHRYIRSHEHRVRPMDLGPGRQQVLHAHQGLQEDAVRAIEDRLRFDFAREAVPLLGSAAALHLLGDAARSRMANVKSPVKASAPS